MTDDKRTFRSTFTSYHENVGGPITGNVSEEFRLYPASAVEVAYAKGYAAGAEAMLKAALEWGYDLGFGASDEGWNAQCGVDSPEEKAEWAEQRRALIVAAISGATAPIETEKETERLLIEKVRELQKELAEALRALIVVRNAVNEVL